jgi:ABC-type anion transport system duplicated permease subunit
VSVGQNFTCYAEAFPAVTMIVLYVNDTVVSNSSQSQIYTLQLVGVYTINCVAFNYIYGTSSLPCNGTASVSGTAIEAGKYQCNNKFSSSS